MKKLALLTVLAFLSGCFIHAPANAATDAADLSNTLIYAGENEDTLNPILNNHGELPGIIFSGLMKYDVKGAPIPDLAESFIYDNSALTYTFKLRQGVKWHDGTNFTAGDVVFTYKLLAEDENLTASIKSNYEDIADITAPDAETVVFKLSQYNAAMLDNFTIGILPEHILKGRNIATTPFNQQPVGTGRYKFVEWDTAGGTITVERNTDYYGKVPNIDRVVYKTVAVESAKALMLQSGEADLAWLNANYAERFRGNTGFKNIDFVTADFRSVAMDFHTDFWQKNGDSIGVLNYAVDKQSIINGVLNKQGGAAFSPIQLNAFGGNKRADLYAYDVEKFAEAMTKLGWAKGSDGIYERAGQKFSFTIQVRDYEEERVDIANIVASQLKSAGVDMRIALVTRFDWKAGYNGFLAGYAVEFDPDGAYSNFVTNASQNTMAYSNPEVDELLKRGRHTADPTERRKIYGDFEATWAKRPGHLLVAYLDGNYVSVAGLSGLNNERVLGHHAVGVMWNIEEWTLTR
ncbi:MAG: ABC transporter substrate-binding protein [Synergistaceae bacterium]|jgi:peptide/nickel transport system substrate-binding protein|nr:ABC transporter substrate-binding protein [Synergistaceae bacterium]